MVFKKFNRDPAKFEDGSDYYYEDEKKACCVCSWKRCLKSTLITTFSLLLSLFILVWVIFPIVFMCNVSIQRLLMFPNFDQPSNPEYNNFAKYGAVGVRNLYANVLDLDNKTIISLGIWHVLPEELISESESNSDFSYDDALNSTKYDVIIYCHGNSGTRIYPYPTYKVLRKFFHVIAVDYRSYGDTTTAELSEKGVVNDLVQFYRWVRSRTPAKIYVWGHSLGSSLGTHMVAKLSEIDIMPTGLALEAPFTTMHEEIAVHPLGKIFAWLAYFDATIRDPLKKNGFLFESTTYILNVTCPIMILHAEDDSIIPSTLGEKLYKTANESVHLQHSPDLTTFHLISAKHKLNHMNINQAPELPQYITDWKTVCSKHNLGKG